MRKRSFDFGGWATKNDLLCADGRTIRKNAFKDDDGRTVPLVWQHNHEDPTRVIGHALLENREDGVYAHCSFNNTDIAKHVKELVRHEDVNSLSIYANKLKQDGGDVLHGVIREVSIVLAGANPGAMIEFPIMEHGEESETEAKIWPGETSLDLEGMAIQHSEEDDEAEVTKNPQELAHADKEDDEEAADENETVQDVLNGMTEEQRKVVEFLVGQALEGDEAEHSADYNEDDLSHAEDDEDEDNGKTVQDVLDTMNSKQKKVVEYLVAQAIEARENAQTGKEEEEDKEASHSINDEEETIMRNAFENSAQEMEQNNTLTHAQLMTIANDAKKIGSMREAVLAHSQDYGIEQIDYLMPEYQEFSGNGAPQFKKRDTTWVAKVMNGVHHTPFAKVKTTFADITEDQARARGYIKGHLKKTEVFKLLKREVTPDTVYKKQKIDRDDAIDLSNGFDMVAWLKGEMRMMLDEELARAFIIGDGRADDSEDKIKEDKIVPVLRDEELFVVRHTIDPETEDLIDAVTYAFEDYQGSGNCIAIMTRRQYSTLKLQKDKMGRRLYNSDAEIASALGVKEVIFMPQMGDKSTIREDTDANKFYKPLCIILDLDDYNVGADKGGSINLFEDFDIDYNQMKYLIETRCSGALVKPFSAIVVEEEVEDPT